MQAAGLYERHCLAEIVGLKCHWNAGKTASEKAQLDMCAARRNSFQITCDYRPDFMRWDGSGKAGYPALRTKYAGKRASGVGNENRNDIVFFHGYKLYPEFLSVNEIIIFTAKNLVGIGRFREKRHVQVACQAKKATKNVKHKKVSFILLPIHYIMIYFNRNVKVL